MIDKNKQYTTRSGLPVEIYATDRGGIYSVHGAVFEEGVWSPISWTSEGNVLAGQLDDFDIIEVKPRIQRKVWVNVYKDGVSLVHRTRKRADKFSSPHRIACIEIEINCEEGEGL